MKDYELSVVFHPDLEMNLDPALDKVKKIIESNKGKITKEENDGKKRLAYSINGQDFGVYYYFDLQLPAEAPAKISSTFNITDEVLRYLLVKTDPRRAKAAALRKEEESAESVSDETTNQEKGE
ncbi:30S ribosomal protein S6 [Candidatus Saccharibacteria bacterium]|nr:30S ribosomal protein S6 [Candidatus Saccharibacteria bacterium]